jgi:hypothetical protein
MGIVWPAADAQNLDLSSRVLYRADKSARLLLMIFEKAAVSHANANELKYLRRLP